MAGQGAFGYLPDIVDMGAPRCCGWGRPVPEPAVEGADRPARPRYPRRCSPVTTTAEPCGSPRRTGPAEIAAVAAPPWEGTRVLYLQHASDPVVWWSPHLFLRKPDWLKEPPGFDRTRAMRWYPIVVLPGDRGHGRERHQLHRRTPPATAISTEISSSTAGGSRVAGGLDAVRHRPDPPSLDRAMTAGGPEFA